MNRNTPEDLVRELLSSNRSIAQDTMEDGFTTLHTKEGVPYIANLDPEEKARYSETKIPLSKIKKDGKDGKELTTSKKDKKADTDSNLTDLQKKIKALTEGKEYTEEVANKVGDVMRQELEKDKEFTDLVKKLKDVSTFEDEWSKVSVRTIKSDPRYKAVEKQIKDLKKKYPGGYYMYKGGYDEYFKLYEESTKIYKEVYSELQQGILDKINPNMTKQERDFITGKTDNKFSVSEKMISLFKNKFKNIINFNTGNNIKAPKTQKANVSNGLAMYSQELVKSIEDRGVSVKTLKEGSRAYHSGLHRTVNITLKDGYGTAAHEFAHAIESANPGIVKIEKEFYERRTKGDELRYINDVVENKGYGYDEKTKTDNFVHPYVGKYYKSERNFELLSMGMSYLYERPNMLTKDKDYMNFVLGCLAYKG